ncbi:hypothetical protein D3C72_1532820 [compost metagenome]
MARDVAPEQFSITAAHDALVRIASLGVHDGNDAVTGAQEFVMRGVEYFEGLVVQLGARIAEHGRQRFVAATHDAVFRHAHAHGRVQEDAFIIDG